MTTLAESSTFSGSVAGTLRATRAAAIDAINQAAWDALVPRDFPHLRCGFLAALERSGQCRSPQYIEVWAGETLIAVAMAYQLDVDLLTLAPRWITRYLNAFRTRFAPKLLYMKSLACGPIITNCRSNVYIAERLSVADRRRAARELVKALEAIPDSPPLKLLFDLSEAEVATFEPALRAGGFLQGASLPGAVLDVQWVNLESYTARLRKAFRRTVLKDREMGAGLQFEIITDWAALADEVWLLYRNVFDRADYVLQALTPEFFKEFAAIDESRIVVARDGPGGRIVGVEVLLCGETELQDVFTGQDYAWDAEKRVYFNLIYPVIDLAGREGFRKVSLGPTAYAFKARLGATTYPLSVFVRHRNPVVQAALAALKDILFSEAKPITYNVFRADG